MKSYKKSTIPDFNKFKKAILETVDNTVYGMVIEWADFHRELFVKRLYEQDFASFKVILYAESGTNLSPEWLAKKKAAGADLRTMVATHQYALGINVFKSKGAGLSRTVRVGFHHLAKTRSITGNRKSTLLDTVARTQEFGSLALNIPARPHWMPHLRVMEEAASAFRSEINKELAEALKGIK